MRRGAETAGAYRTVDADGHALNPAMGCPECYPNYYDGCPACGVDAARDRRRESVRLLAERDPSPEALRDDEHADPDGWWYR
jgi:hypothetical protein